MASSILRLTSPISKATAGSYLRHVSVPQNHLLRMICSAGMSSTAGGGDSAVKPVAAPWLMLPPSSVTGGDTARYSMYSPSQGTVVRLKQDSQSLYPHDGAKVVGSSHGWLTLFNEHHRKLFLWNPINHRSMNLPLVDSMALAVKDVSKVILSCPPEDDECVAVMAYGSHIGHKLAHCRPHRSTSWTTFGGLAGDIGLKKQIPDFMYSSRFKQFLCLSEMEEKLGFETGLWYLHREKTTGKVGFDFMGSSSLGGEEKYDITGDDKLRWRRYVVYADNSDQLFVVTRLLVTGGDAYNCKTVGFHVHSLYNKGFFGSSTQIRERYMKESLDGLVMFVGPNHSCAVPAAKFPELKPNSIYFAGDDVGIYDYGSRTISPCYYGNDVVQRGQPPAFWFTPSTVPARWPMFQDDFTAGGGDDNFKSFQNDLYKSFQRDFFGGDDNFYGGTKISDLSIKHKGTIIYIKNMVINNIYY